LDSTRITFLFGRINFDALHWTKRNRNATIHRRDLFFLLEVELAVAVEKRLAQHASARWIHLDIAFSGARTLEAKVAGITVFANGVLSAWIVEALVLLSVCAVELSKKLGETSMFDSFEEQATGTNCLLTYLGNSKVAGVAKVAIRSSSIHGAGWVAAKTATRVDVNFVICDLWKNGQLKNVNCISKTLSNKKRWCVCCVNQQKAPHPCLHS
jgi:hypothetical protein